MGNSLAEWNVIFIPYAHSAFLPSPISDFLLFLGLRLQITCLGTLGTKFLPFVSLMRPLGSSFLFLESSQFFRRSWFSDSHDFFVNYFKNPLKLLHFGRTRITDSNIENIIKVPMLSIWSVGLTFAKTNICTWCWIRCSHILAQFSVPCLYGMFNTRFILLRNPCLFNLCSKKLVFPEERYF